ncbi:MAG: zinc ribbon domain-containing protein [Bacillota bacterium]
MSKIEKMLQLQTIENEIVRTEHHYKDVMEAKEINDKIQLHKKMKRHCEELQNRIHQDKEVLKDRETTLSEIHKKKENLKDKLYGGKINDLKQLGVLMHEEERMDEEIQQTEKNIEQLMEAIEGNEKRLSEISLKEKRLGAVIKKNLKEREEKRGNLVKIRGDLLRQKEEAVQLLGQDLMKVYEDVKKRKHNPIAEAKNDICGGCHMDLPIMVLMELRKDKIIYCSNCGRILYLSDRG